MSDEETKLEALLHAHDTGLAPIVPHWVQNTTEKDLLAGGVGWMDQWRTDQSFRDRGWRFLREGLLLADVSFSKLLPALHPEYRNELEKGKFINGQALRILEHWRDNTSLTAPCCALTQDGSEVQVYVGNHRTNSALRLAVPRIHLLIPKAQLPRFHELLGDFPSHDQTLIKFVDPNAWWENTPSPEADS